MWRFVNSRKSSDHVIIQLSNCLMADNIPDNKVQQTLKSSGEVSSCVDEGIINHGFEHTHDTLEAETENKLTSGEEIRSLEANEAAKNAAQSPGVAADQNGSIVIELNTAAKHSTILTNGHAGPHMELQETSGTVRSFAPPASPRKNAASNNGQANKHGRWSLISLRKTFEEVDIEGLYQRYWIRIRRSLLLALLLVLSVYELALIISFNTIVRARTGVVGVNVTLSCALALSLTCLVIVFKTRLYTRVRYVLGGVVWIIMFVTIYVFDVFADRREVIDNAAMVFYLIFVVHTMLPFSGRVSFALGVLTGLIDCVLVGVLDKTGTQWKIRQMTANVIIYTCANLTGLYHKHLTDIVHRHTFLETRRFIETDIGRIKVGEQQNRMKEGLLLKVIPRHLLEDMKRLLTRRLVEVEIHSTQQFRDLLVQRHDNVSILYADIVSFTPLTSAMTPEELVKALNELFGRFDQLARNNKCYRIKMLGDCYYCVSGLPEPNRDHARNCVIMGLQMIQVIRVIRQETGVATLDMRIGIHSGYVLSGVLGLRKWQYDIWSDDVTLANHMEAGGLPGRVHVTESSCKELKGEFELEPGTGNDRDDYIRDHRVTTFFVADSELEKVTVDEYIRRPSGSGHPKKKLGMTRRKHAVAQFMDNWGAEKPFDRLSEYMERTIPKRAEVNRRLEAGFHLEESDSSQDHGEWLALGTKEIGRFTLRFKDLTMEMQYLHLRDPAFKFYIMCAFLILICMGVVQLLLLSREPVVFITYGLGVLLFVSLLILTTGLRCLFFYKKFPTNVKRHLRAVSTLVTSNFWLKLLLVFLSLAMIFIASMVTVIDCETLNSQVNLTVLFNATETLEDKEGRICLYGPYYLYGCMLALIACSVFLRMSYIAKTCFMIVGLTCFNVMFYHVFGHVFEIYDRLVGLDFLELRVRGTFYTSVLFFTLIVLDRQIEKNMRLDFLWQKKIEQGQEEMERNECLNTLLLANILPKHVADHFMRPNRNRNEIFHQCCKNTAVMFAAIPNFTAIFSTVDVMGKECLRLLNEIICDFDKLLVTRQYDGVEKIKTIGSTYMAAAGLQALNDTEEDEEVAARNVVALLQFAAGMISQLENINSNGFTDYKLRIGLNHGEVIAGVVGASKPQYDIWGDTVNVASRMESHGIIGRIQVSDRTAALLEKRGYKCEPRGTMRVKGKGQMKVYMVSEESVQTTGPETVTLRVIDTRASR